MKIREIIGDRQVVELTTAVRAGVSLHLAVEFDYSPLLTDRHAIEPLQYVNRGDELFFQSDGAVPPVVFLW